VPLRDLPDPMAATEPRGIGLRLLREAYDRIAAKHTETCDSNKHVHGDNRTFGNGLIIGLELALSIIADLKGEE